MSPDIDRSRPGRLAVCLRGISFSDGVGGMERAAGQHLRLMVSAGMDVTLFAPGRFVAGSPPHGVDVVDVAWPGWNRGSGSPLFGLAYRVWTKRLARALSASVRSGDLVHFHGATANAIPGLERAVTVANPHGMEEFGRASVSRLPNRLVLRRMSRRAREADAVIATDDRLVPRVVQNIGVSPDRIAVIPNAVDLRALEDLAEKRGLSEASEFTIVSIGRLVDNKGYDLLAHALAQPEVLHALPANWRWIHYGSGPRRQDLLEIAGRLIPGRLEIRADRTDEEVQTTLAGASLFVQPSRYEGSSLTTLEAMAHGVTVVATPVGGIPDKVQDGVTGYLATEPSASALADALTRALNSDRPVGFNARELVRTRFSEQAMADSYVELYRLLLSRREAVRSGTNS